jgi:SAM-dependent methyltransferase
MELKELDFTGKTILEVGCGRGDTTRWLAGLLAGVPDAALIVTDISDQHFPQLQSDLEHAGVSAAFLATSAEQLAGVRDASVDVIVCNYCLCAVNASPGKAMLALRRFWQVLCPMGWLFIEEEFPIQFARGPAQQVWAEKWRLLKAASLLAGKPVYTEFNPAVLGELCQVAGFQHLNWQPDCSYLPGVEALDFFRRRLDAMILPMQNEALKGGFSSMAAGVVQAARLAGGMEIPFYRLTARKP